MHAINLLGTKENEATLTNAYGRHLQIARGVLGDDLGITHFDFHNAVRIGGHDSVVRELRYLSSLFVGVLIFTLQLEGWKLSQTTSINSASRCAMLVPTKSSPTKKVSSGQTV